MEIDGNLNWLVTFKARLGHDFIKIVNFNVIKSIYLYEHCFCAFGSNFPIFAINISEMHGL